METLMTTLKNDVDNTSEQLNIKSPLKAVLNRGSQILTSPNNSQLDIAFKGRTTVNMVPLFESDRWVLHSNVELDAPNKITLNAYTQSETSQIEIRVMEDSYYRISSTMSSDECRLKVTALNETGDIITDLKDDSLEGATLKTPLGTRTLRIILYNNIPGIFTFENIMLYDVMGSLDINLLEPNSDLIGKVSSYANWDSTIYTSGGQYYLDIDTNTYYQSLIQFVIATKPNTEFIFKFSSTSVNGNEYVSVHENDTSKRFKMDFLQSFSSTDKDNYHIIKTGPNGKYLILTFQSYYGEPDTIQFSGLELKEIKPQPFAANVKGITNPTIANKTTNESLTIKGTFYDGEDVYLDENSKLVVDKRWGEMYLNEEGLEYSFGINSTGFKSVIVKLPFNHPLPSNRYLVKYDGSLIRNGTSSSEGPDVNYGVDTLYITVDNEDSGWVRLLYQPLRKLKLIS